MCIRDRVNAAVKKAYGNEHEIEWMEVLAGERAFKETGSWSVSYTHLCIFINFQG